jgi:hypothetical protein
MAIKTIVSTRQGVFVGDVISNTDRAIGMDNCYFFEEIVSFKFIIRDMLNTDPHVITPHRCKVPVPLTLIKENINHYLEIEDLGDKYGN